MDSNLPGKLLRLSLAVLCVGCGNPVLSLQSQYRADRAVQRSVRLEPVQWAPEARDAQDLTKTGWYAGFWGNTQKVDQLWQDYFRRANVVERVAGDADAAENQPSPLSVRLCVTKFRTQINKGEAVANSILFGFVTWLAVFIPVTHELELETRLEVADGGSKPLLTNTWTSESQKRAYSLVNRPELIGRDMSELFESAFRAHCQFLAAELEKPSLLAAH